MTANNTEDTDDDIATGLTYRDVRAPLVIKIMLAIYCSGEPHLEIGAAQWGSRAGLATRRWLERNRLTDEQGAITERGKAWVHFIVNTPLPQQTWTLPTRGASIQGDE